MKTGLESPFPAQIARHAHLPSSSFGGMSHNTALQENGTSNPALAAESRTLPVSFRIPISRLNPSRMNDQREPVQFVRNIRLPHITRRARDGTQTARLWTLHSSIPAARTALSASSFTSWDAQM